MKNTIIGILIICLYWSNYHICNLFYLNDNYNWFKLKFALLSICLLLSFEYIKKDNFIEKLFCAIIFNDIYVLLFKDETGYTLHDIYFIIIFTMLQYIKNTKFIKKWLNKY
jgi:hypothetical protein